jgi:hypothetical protein
MEKTRTYIVINSDKSIMKLTVPADFIMGHTGHHGTLFVYEQVRDRFNWSIKNFGFTFSQRKVACFPAVESYYVDSIIKESMK